MPGSLSFHLRLLRSYRIQHLNGKLQTTKHIRISGQPKRKILVSLRKTEADTRVVISVAILNSDKARPHFFSWNHACVLPSEKRIAITGKKFIKKISDAAWYDPEDIK